MHWTPQYTKKAQITLIVSNVSITSIDGKNITSSENLLGGVIIGVHSDDDDVCFVLVRHA
jgi:hypothetical protein